MSAFRAGTWNVRTEKTWGRAEDALRTILGDYRPHVMALQEVYGAPRRLGGMFPGYRVAYHAFGMPRVIGGVVQENGAQAILISDRVSLKIREALAMTEEWRGPNGRKHAPRIHRRVTVNHERENWRFLGWHGTPGRKGRAEGNRAAARNLASLGDIGPVILAGDLNQRPADVLKRIPGDYRIAAQGLDAFLYDGCHLSDMWTLPKHGSDHHPLIADFVL